MAQQTGCARAHDICCTGENTVNSVSVTDSRINDSAARISTYVWSHCTPLANLSDSPKHTKIPPAKTLVLVYTTFSTTNF